MKSPNDFVSLMHGDDRKSGGNGDTFLQTVLVRAQCGEIAAKNYLCSYVWKVAYNRALNVTLPTVYEPRDFAQDVVIQFLVQFLRIQDLEKWLIRICYGVRARAFRNHHQKFLALIEDISPGEAESFEAKQLTSLALTAAFEALKPRQRKIVYLRYQDDLPFAEIAKIMGMREGAVKTVFWRTKAKLKKTLDSTPGEGYHHATNSRRT